MLPSLLVALLYGSWPVRISQGFIALTTFCFHSCPLSGRPRLLAASKFFDIVAMVLAMVCLVASAGGATMPMLSLHLAACVICLVSVRDWTSHTNGPAIANVLGPLSLFNCAVFAPYAQLAYLATPWLLTMCCILTLRRRDLSQYVAITAHVFNSWMVYHSCIMARLAASGSSKNVFQFVADTLLLRPTGVSG